MDNSSTVSSISVTESEASLLSRNSSYRSCVRKLTGEPQFKKLYVDLSSCRLDVRNQEDNLYHQLVPAPNYRSRRSSTSSNDSRELDFERYPCSRSLHKIMDNPCDPSDRNRGNWLKYFAFLCFTSILYIYIQTMHSSNVLKRINKDMDKFRLNMDESQFKLNHIEKMLSGIKREQDKQQNKISSVISKEIEKYSSDKTGMTDFALEATGGKIVQLSPGTENFEQAVTFFGMTLCDGKHGPRAMIQADMSPGHCWAIKGSSGGAIIKLLGRVKVNSVSLEHISKSLSPTGEVTSAPKTFSVWGLTHVTDRGQQLGTFTYDLRGSLVQTFPVRNSNVFEYVEFRVLTNQGHADFTCIYRFRVHGVLEKLHAEGK
ncbi:hypothetical protein NQ315_001699 [Exocentrus adspersus]|uniref:SUN domain-containing protein n=1 Tax=Exocentrus adspersus TaxID=1586481 RepID=A0AAV8WAA2_9CUCU|nr:hypothetical protein NQ315_001699 [Exocentrus adspersus]